MTNIIEITDKQAKDCFLLDTKSLKFWNFQQWESELKKEYVKALAVFKSEKIVGACLSQMTNDEADLLYMAIHPEFQRRGIGKSLFSEFINMSRKNNIKKIFLEVSAKNIPAIKFYDYFNFKTTSVRKKYYQDGSDALLKSKEIC